MTSQQPENPPFTEADIPDTEVISVFTPAPVFVDSTGRRSRRLRRLAYGFGALVMVYGGLISVSLAGGPVRSSVMLPLPGFEPEKATVTPTPTVAPTPTPSASPTARGRALFLTDGLPRRGAVPRAKEPRLESTRVKPTRTKPSSTKTLKPRSTTKPTESTTTSPATTPATTPAVTPGPTTPPVVPVPPGGSGGGTPLVRTEGAR